MSPHFTIVEDVDAPPLSGDGHTSQSQGAVEFHQNNQPGTAALPSNGIKHQNDIGDQHGQTNGHTDDHESVIGATAGQQPKSRYLRGLKVEGVYDLVCVGFGPASLAIAVALHDALEEGSLKELPRVLFLERQPRFAWHAGMLLPGAKMQISFIKDLASLRNPRSNFTFLNYLHTKGRLVEFTNLNTFLPARVEYEDYLRWCASHFDDVVKYQSEVLSVAPMRGAGPPTTFEVKSEDVQTGITSSYCARNVLLAIGGKASIPPFLPQSPRIIHSSQYAQAVPKILNDRSASYRVAVIGAGQSAAEIFNNIQTLYPNSRTHLIMRSEFLKPSDDSPFVNSIFNPAFVDSLYPKSSAYRNALLEDARATNYGVVRLELIDQLYERMYEQRRDIGPDEKNWPHRILGGRQVIDVKEDGNVLRLRVCLAPQGEALQDGPLFEEEALDVDLIIAATGYNRNAHIDMLKEVWPLLPASQNKKEPHLASIKDRWLVETETTESEDAPPTKTTRILEVGRNYGVRFAPGAVAQGSGVWLQGCCEGTHGLSDTLLSVLGTRSGEIVESIFGKQAASQ